MARLVTVMLLILMPPPSSSSSSSSSQVNHGGMAYCVGTSESEAGGGSGEGS